MATKMTAPPLDQGAVYVAEPANNAAEPYRLRVVDSELNFRSCTLPLTVCKYFTSQNLYLTKFSPVKFSPLELTGEIGENLPLAKISRYTVHTAMYVDQRALSEDAQWGKGPAMGGSDAGPHSQRDGRG